MSDEIEVVIPCTLSDGTEVLVKAVDLGGAQDVGIASYALDHLRAAISGTVKLVFETMDQLKPTTTKVSFGIELAVKDGMLTGLLSRGEGKGTMQLELEWKAEAKAP